MAGLTTKKVVKKQKKHGNKSGRKTAIRPSQKKAVKNGRHQEVDGPKKSVKNVKKAVSTAKQVHQIDDAELEPFGDVPEEDVIVDENDEYVEEEEFIDEFDDTGYEDLDPNFPDKEY